MSDKFVRVIELLNTKKIITKKIITPLLLTLLVCTFAVAQEQTGRPVPQQPATTSGVVDVASLPVRISRAEEDRYRIGPGDVLDIRIFNKPQFSRDGVRVDSRGMLRMPLIEGEILAACRTEAELAADIQNRYLEFVRSPQVDVFVKEYQSQPVAVIGAVRAPSRFQLQRRVRLLDLLSFVGGPSTNAGRSVQIVHTAANAFTCSERAGINAAPPPPLPQPASPVDDLGAIDSYLLSETLLGTEQSNPYLRPGDIVNVPEADQIFVVGNVLKPSAIPLREPMTVTRAIAMAGGTMPDTKSNRIRIVRQLPGTTEKREIFVDLQAIDKRRAEDVALQANDIVDVPTSAGKRLFRQLIGAVVPAVGQLPVRVVP